MKFGLIPPLFLQFPVSGLGILKKIKRKYKIIMRDMCQQEQFLCLSNTTITHTYLVGSFLKNNFYISVQSGLSFLVLFIIKCHENPKFNFFQLENKNLREHLRWHILFCFKKNTNVYFLSAGTSILYKLCTLGRQVYSTEHPFKNTTSFKKKNTIKFL